MTTDELIDVLQATDPSRPLTPSNQPAGPIPDPRGRLDAGEWYGYACHLEGELELAHGHISRLIWRLFAKRNLENDVLELLAERQDRETCGSNE